MNLEQADARDLQVELLLRAMRATRTKEHLGVNPPDILVQQMVSLISKAWADMNAIMPVFEPSGDREHCGWNTLRELRGFLHEIEMLDLDALSGLDALANEDEEDPPE